MFGTFWVEFGIILLAATFGSIAVLPYSMRLVKESGKTKKLKLPLWLLFLISVLQNIILFSVVIGIGLLVAHQVGLGAPLIEAIISGKSTNHVLTSLFIPFLLGIFGGGALLIMDLALVPYFPEKLLKTALKTTQMENFTASFYGGINEELLMRLFGISVIAWLLARAWHTASGLPTTVDFIIANIVMAVIFAIGHLPALKSLLGNITRVILLRTLLLNMVIGLICGYVFWRYGIEGAILTHFVADIIYHVGGTYVLRKKFRK